MANLLTNLSPIGKKLLVIAGIIVMIAVFDRFLIGTYLTSITNVDQDINKEKSIIKQNLHFLSYKERILKESKLYEPYVSKELPAEEEIIAAFLKRLELLAGKANVTIIKITPSAGVQERDYLKYTADLECSGKLADVISFMHLVDTADELMKVVKFNFSSKKSDSDDLKAVMTISKIIVGKRPPLPPATAGKSGDPKTATTPDSQPARP
jgi:hypothetical protein